MAEVCAPSVLFPISNQAKSHSHTSIAPNDQEDHNLNCKADPIAHKHNTIDRPVHACKLQRPSVSRCLGKQILECCWREVEQRQPVVPNVVGIVCPDLPLRRLIRRVKLIRRHEGFIIRRVTAFFHHTFRRVFGRGHNGEARVGRGRRVRLTGCRQEGEVRAARSRFGG